jgi:hypothetical protein
MSAEFSLKTLGKYSLTPLFSTCLAPTTAQQTPKKTPPGPFELSVRSLKRPCNHPLSTGHHIDQASEEEKTTLPTNALPHSITPC